MNWKYCDIVKFCFKKKIINDLCKSKYGLERECLRVTPDGLLARTPHPTALGSALTHPYITTDFSESQPELVTPAYNQAKTTLTFLHELQQYVNSHLSNELLWPFSTPCMLPSNRNIPLANYGQSDLGIEKHLYRKGLSFRYGPKMQTLSGVHYNFSLSDVVWEQLYLMFGKGEKRDVFISNGYFHLCRNYLRMGWLNTYLFGSTPCVDYSFFDQPPKDIQSFDARTYYYPYATSIRLSRYGYYSREQDTIHVSYNDLGSYIKDLDHALRTPSPKFSQSHLPEQQKAEQLNDHLLQIPAEHYVRIRPKLIHPLSGNQSEVLKKNRVKYVEARDLDINPFIVEGVELSQMHYLHIFMLHCLFKESPTIEDAELELIRQNQDDVSLKGRDPNLKLRRIGGKALSLREWGLSLLDEMNSVAEVLDQSYPYHSTPFTNALREQREKIFDSHKTPSARVLQTLADQSMSYIDLGLHLACEHQKELERKPLKSRVVDRFDAVSRASHLKQKEKEVLDDFILKGYEDMELSTQMVIREAYRRKIDVEIIDRSDNFIYLHKDGHSAFVKQATCTDRDSFMTYLMMENKVVTKHVLNQVGISVPLGNVYTDYDLTISVYSKIGHKKLVVKPVFTNFGIGVYIIEPGDEKQYIRAVTEAFTHGKEVIVEEFCEGEEFRFLIIGDKTVAVCQRLPANVVGDGIHTIKELAKIKNFDPLCYKVPKYHIKFGRQERDFLKQQQLRVDSIPAIGQRVYLRQNSNVSTGGDPVDVTDQVHESYKALALKAAQVVKARICGVDMIIHDRKQVCDKTNYSIIELNFNPALLLHRYPVSGKIHYVERDLLDELGFK